MTVRMDTIIFSVSLNNKEELLFGGVFAAKAVF